jgi:hypothetical protein
MGNCSRLRSDQCQSAQTISTLPAVTQTGGASHSAVRLKPLSLAATFEVISEKPITAASSAVKHGQGSFSSACC